MTHPFNPSEHPRGHSGEFVTAPHAEPDVSLTFAPGPEPTEPDNDDGDGTTEPWPFTPDEGDFPRKKESVFAPGKPVTGLGPDTEDNEANRAYEAREAASRPARRGIFSRMFSALESFSTSVDTRHRDEMDELESLARQDRIARAAKRSGN